MFPPEICMRYVPGSNPVKVVVNELALPVAQPIPTSAPQPPCQSAKLGLLMPPVMFTLSSEPVKVT